MLPLISGACVAAKVGLVDGFLEPQDVLQLRLQIGHRIATAAGRQVLWLAAQQHVGGADDDDDPVAFAVFARSRSAKALSTEVWIRISLMIDIDDWPPAL